MPGLDSEALDIRVASESFAPFRKLARRDLETLRLLTDHRGKRVPTVGGVILFGTDRERRFPDAWIQAGRFPGTDKRRIVDRVEIRSLPVRAIEEAIAFVQKHALHGAEIGPVRRRERWNLPPDAVRVAIINAVAHLWGAANILRGKTAGQDYRKYILSLMFYKRLCDQWKCEADDGIAEQERQQGRAFSEKQKAVFR